MDKWTVDNKQNTNGEQPVAAAMGTMAMETAATAATTTAAATMVVATMAVKRKQDPVGPG